MIYIGTVSEMNPSAYAENWMIVRAPDEIPAWARHEPDLSPSPALFADYRKAFVSGAFGRDYFDRVYIPRFLRELAENEKAQALLEELARRSRQEDLFLCCYCQDETLCHRSIIAGVLLGMGAAIRTRCDYLKYSVLYEAR